MGVFAILRYSTATAAATDPWFWKFGNAAERHKSVEFSLEGASRPPRAEGLRVATGAASGLQAISGHREREAKGQD